MGLEPTTFASFHGGPESNALPLRHPTADETESFGQHKKLDWIAGRRLPTASSHDSISYRNSRHGRIGPFKDATSLNRSAATPLPT